MFTSFRRLPRPLWSKRLGGQGTGVIPPDSGLLRISLRVSNRCWRNGLLMPGSDSPASRTSIAASGQPFSASRWAALLRAARAHKRLFSRFVSKQSRRVLLQTSVTNLGQAEEPLENQKRVFDFCPNRRLRSVLGLFFLAQGAVTAALLVGKIFLLGGLFTNRVTLAGIGRIVPYSGFLTVQQVARNLVYCLI